MQRRFFYLCALITCLLLFGGCNTTIPDGVQPVKEFQAEKYMGKWYEIARLDHSFERGLQKVYAKYTLREDNSIKVVNRGYNPKEDEWESVSGTAYLVGEEDTGTLKVSFFWPFYGSYNIIYLDDEYQNALVCGSSRSYFWILSREKNIAPEKKEYLVNKAEELGFNVNNLIYPHH